MARHVLSLCVLLLSCVFVWAGDVAPTSAPASAPVLPNYTQQWNSITGSCITAEGTEKLLALIKQSKDVGCNHLVLNESGSYRIEFQKPEYFENVKKVLAFAKENNITLAMGMVSIGYSGTYFHYDVNWDNGNPAKNVPFIVAGKIAKPDPLAVPEIKNPSLQEVADGKLVGWDDTPAPASLLDDQVLFQGKPSLKGGQPVTQNVKCEPFKHYRVTWYVKGPKHADDGSYFFKASSNSPTGHRYHTYTEPTIHPADKDGWSRYEVMFNTYEAEKMHVTFGGGKAGENWFAGLKVEPAGLLLVLHRPKLPFVVTSADGKTVYEEGKDFKQAIDPILARKPFPGDFPIDHEAPVLELTDGSRIQDGQKLLVSYFHHMSVYTDQDDISMAEPATWDVLTRSIKQVIATWNTGHYFLNYDEIRMGGWEEMPDPSIKTMGQLLAWHFRKSYDLVKASDPNATIYTWSDMFTPFHNAAPKSHYYYVNGDWSGSWENFPKDVVIMMWYSPTPEGMRFFADRGHKQILCGFYDGKSTAAMEKNIQHWIEMSRGIPGVEGFMYCTFQGNYASMPEYFQLLRTYSQWAKLGEAGTAPKEH